MASSARVLQIEKRLVLRTLERTGAPPIELVLWNGERIRASARAPIASLHVSNRRTLAKLAYYPELYFGDAYSDGSMRIEGDLIALLEAIYTSFPSDREKGSLRRLVDRWLARRQRNTRDGSRRNIHHHYDIRTDFYSLWLDSQLLYTCAYYPSPEDDLDEAQIAKMHHVCRKMQLQPGETVVEAGCGWGALALHMARHFGVTVRAFNLSREQIAYARDRAAREGLASRVEFVEDDYRNISGRYDVFVSVGMLEHVGYEHYRELGRVIDRSIADNGRGFLHFIGRDRERPLNAWIRRRIFPGAYPPTLGQAMEILEPWGFSVLDVENMRLHYARTLEHWLQRFERHAGGVATMFNPSFVRAWRLYLAGSLVAFRTGWLQLFQVAFARRASNRVPWTRAYLYAGEGESEGKRSWIPAMS